MLSGSQDKYSFHNPSLLQEMPSFTAGPFPEDSLSFLVFPDSHRFLPVAPFPHVLPPIFLCLQVQAL